MKKVIVDTDPGIDDAQAILYALAHPELDVIGITTIYGNVSADLATANALRLLDLAEHSTEVPVAQGSSVPLTIPPNPVADFVHGKNGFGEVELPVSKRSADSRSAAQLIVDLVHAHPNEVTLVPVGPLTNIALAVQLDPSIVDLVESIVIMGGAVEHKGNVTDYAEANIWNDPHAAHIVVTQKWKKLALVGLDVTMQVHMYPDFFGRVATASSKCGAFLKASSEFYAKFYLEHHGFDGCCPHDLCALVYVANPLFFEGKSCPGLDVIVEGEKIGQTVVTGNAGGTPSCQYIVKVDADKLLEAYIQVIKVLP